MQSPPESTSLSDASLPIRNSGNSSEDDLIDILPCVIWVYSDDLQNLLHVSAAYERVWGQPVESLYQSPLSWIDAVHSKDRHLALAALQRPGGAEDEQEARPVELRVLAGDRPPHWVRLQVFHLRGLDGRGIYRCAIALDITAHKRVKEILHHQQEGQEIILDSVPAMIFYKDTENRILRVNRALAEAVGLPKSAIEGRSAYELFPDQAEAYWQDDREVMSSGRSKWDGQEPISTSSGLRWWQTSKIPHRDDEGNVVGVVGFSLDITERKQADEALRLGNAKLSLLADSATRLVGLTSEENGYQFVADRFRELADAILVHLSTYDPESYMLTAQAFSCSEAIRKRLVCEVPYPLMHAKYPLWPEASQSLKKRQLVPIAGVYELTLGRISREDAESLEQLMGMGEIWGIGLAQDDQLLGTATFALPKGKRLVLPHIIETFAYQVTIWMRRQQIERDLRESEALFRNLFQNIGDAFVLLDEQLRVVDMNELAHDLLKLTIGALGRPFAQACGALASNGTALTELLEDVLKSGEVRQNVEVCCRKAAGDTGSVAYLVVTIYRVYVEGEPHVALLCRDISERRRLADETQRAMRLEALARLAFGVAHDFGNFLAIIRGEAELMSGQAPQDAMLGEYLDTILRVVEDGTSLSQQLLAFSRGETIQPDILHLNVLIERAQRMLCRVLGNDIALELDLSSKSIFFWGDKGLFDRVLVNLVSNARDAMPDGGTLTITTRLEELQGVEAERLGLIPGLYAVITVRDTGEGIDEEALHRIFDPFFTTRARNKRFGMGMGLSVVYGIMQQQQGQITATSQPGQGTTFTLYFPAVVVEDWMLDESNAPSAPEG